MFDHSQTTSANQPSPGQYWRALDSYPRAPATPSKVPNWLALSRLAQHCDSVSQHNPGLCSCQCCIQCHLMHLAIIYSQSTKYNSLKTKYYYSAVVAVGVNAICGGSGQGGGGGWHQRRRWWYKAMRAAVGVTAIRGGCGCGEGDGGRLHRRLQWWCIVQGSVVVVDVW